MFIWSGSGNLKVEDESDVINEADEETAALFDIQTDADALSEDDSGLFTNCGLVQKSDGEGTTSVQVDFVLFGMVDVQSGDLDFNDETLTIDGGTVVGGTFGGATVFIDTGDSGIAEDVVIADGEITGGGTLTIQGESSWTGGAMVGAGETIVESASTLTISGAGSKTLERTLSNYGAINWAQGDISVDGAIINNEADAEFIMAPGVDLIAESVNSEFTNNGMLIVGGEVDKGANVLAVDYTQGATSTLAVELKQKTGNQFDRLTIGGSATLDGTLHVRPLAGYSIAVSDDFAVVSANSRSGTFAAVDFSGFGTKSALARYDSTTAKIVSERPNAATSERLKSSHFEERNIRLLPSTALPAQREVRHGECTQNGTQRSNSFLASTWLVAASDRAGTGHRPGYGQAASAGAGRRAKCAKCSQALIGSGRRQPESNAASAHRV